MDNNSKKIVDADGKELVVDKLRCTSCGACIEVCGTNAIYMKAH